MLFLNIRILEKLDSAPIFWNLPIILHILHDIVFNRYFMIIVDFILGRCCYAMLHLPDTKAGIMNMKLNL